MLKRHTGLTSVYSILRVLVLSHVRLCKYSLCTKYQQNGEAAETSQPGSQRKYIHAHFSCSPSKGELDIISTSIDRPYANFPKNRYLLKAELLDFTGFNLKKNPEYESVDWTRLPNVSVCE